MTLPDFRNRVIQGGDTTATKVAGLPDATGTWDGVTTRSTVSIPTLTGVFTNIGNGTAARCSTGYNTDTKMQFKLSSANAVYGASNTVQPPAIVLLPQIKY